MKNREITYTDLVWCQAVGMSIADAACWLNVSRQSVYTNSKRLGVAFEHGSRGRPHLSGPQLNITMERAARMAEMYANGKMLEEIGREYGVTRERVRQIIKKHCGMTGADGGNVMRGRRRAAAASAKRDAHCLLKYGCMYSQYAGLRAVGREMIRSGTGKETTPTYAFSQQRQNARTQGIAWEMNLWDWWCIWKDSGHWAERGRGNGYWMMRIDTSRPYAVDNVRIATGRDGMHDNHFQRKTT